MLRINLLPAYIAERKKTRNAIIGSSLLFVAVLGATLGYNFGVLAPAVADAQTRADQRQAEADAVTAYANETSQMRSQIAPLKEKVDFVKAVRFHNIVRQEIYRKAAKYTFREVEYNAMSVNSNLLTVNGFVKKLSDIGRAYMTFYGNPDVTAVSISGMPGWPTAEQRQNEVGVQPGQAPLRPAYPVTITATLVRAVAPPQLPASLSGGVGGAAGAGGSMGMPGMAGMAGASPDMGGPPPDGAEGVPPGP